VLLALALAGCVTTPSASAPLKRTDAALLRAELHRAARNHEVLTYRELWEAIAYTDADPGREGAVVLLYSGWTRDADQRGGGESDWSREHV
jgi:hypothetical protein